MPRSSRDLSELPARLSRWLATRLGRDTAPAVAAVSNPSATGMSSETLLFDVTWLDGAATRSGSFVARLAPDPRDVPVFPSYDLEMQYLVVQLVAANSDVPVPRVRWLELDPEPLGTPFFVMDRVEALSRPTSCRTPWGAGCSRPTRPINAGCRTPASASSPPCTASTWRPLAPRPGPRRPRRHGVAAPRREPAALLRLGARRAALLLAGARLRLAGGELARRRRRHGHQLGRRAHRQHPVRRVRSRPPCSTGRWRRSARVRSTSAGSSFCTTSSRTSPGAWACPACPTSCAARTSPRPTSG